MAPIPKPPKNTGKKRTEQQRERDLVTLADMYCQGKTMMSMAEHFKLSYAQIAYDLKEIRQKWMESIKDRMEVMKYEEVAKLTEIERQAWVGWFRSLEDATSIHMKEKQPKPIKTKARRGRNNNATTPTKLSKKLQLVERTTTKEGQAGDPRFLAITKEVCTLRCQILNLIAPQKVALTDPSGEFEWQPIKEEEKAELLNIVFAQRLNLLPHETNGKLPHTENSNGTSAHPDAH